MAGKKSRRRMNKKTTVPIPDVSDQYETVPAKNPFQQAFREAIENHHRYITVPHCMICGDTHEQTPLKKTSPTKYLCTDCFLIQGNM